MDAYSILTGMGRLFIAPVGTTFPALTATPASPWRDIGDTQDGIDVEYNDKVEKIGTDQRTGFVKAERTEETMIVKTKLAEATLENLADLAGVTLLDTAPGVGTIGTREIHLHRGAAMIEYAILFRGKSTYLDGPAQYQVPRGIFSKVDSLKWDKSKNVGIPFTFESLEDWNASTEDERFGKLIAQDAAAT